MKKILGIVMMLVLCVVLVNMNPVHAAQSKYTGGLLDGASIQVTTAIGKPSGPGFTQMTDNNAASSYRIPASYAAWYTFTSPKEITAIVLNSGNTRINMEFYDGNNNLLYTYNSIINNGVQTLPQPVKNVSTVVLKPAGAEYVYEWNVFETPSAPPNPTTINWIQGRDKLISFDWNNTGAKSYNVKRSTSSGGPFALLAASVTGTTYTDTTVTNGVTYYYVVSAVNEAGQSADSAQVAMKPNTTKYTGGLLDGVTLNVGTSLVNLPAATTRAITDNNASSSYRIPASNFAWYKFNSPKEITSIILNSGATKISMEFYDNNNNLLYTYNSIINDGVQTLPQPVKNVSAVVIKPAGAEYVYEWNVFETPSFPPAPTKINWIQGRDKLVTFDWDNTGAKSYNVKRSTSSGGPYVLLASNIAGTTYTDTTVTNGVTYYYVVSAVNEAGQSADSAQVAMKPSATKYTGGLLDGVTLNIGTSLVNLPAATTRAITDNNASSSYRIPAGNFAWYKFNSPKEITSIILNSGATKISMEFYDSNNNILYTYNSIINDGVQTLPQPVKNVSAVVIKPAGAEYVYEWNVFETPSFPPAPTKINWIQGRDKLVTFDWDNTGAKSYNVKRSTSSGGPYALLASNITGTSYTDTAVTNGVTYYYVVSAVNEAGQSADSAQVAMKPSATKYTNGLLDGVTLNLGTAIVKQPSATTRVLTDNNASSSYRIPAGSFAWYSFESPKEITSVILNSGTTNVYMEFYDSNNNLLQTFKTTINDTVQNLPNPVKNVSTVVLKPIAAEYVYEWNVFGKGELPAIPAPKHLSAVAGDAIVNLNWNTVNDAVSYNIKRAVTAGGPYSTVQTVTGSTYNYVDTSVVNGTTYYYVVTTVGAGGESINSNEASATPKANVLPTPVPQNLRATAGDAQVKLYWTAVNNVTSYNIKRAVTAGGPYSTVQTVTGSTYDYLDTNVINGTTYYYVVTAVGAGGESSNSNEAFATPKANVQPTPVPQNLRATAGDAKVTLGWNGVNHATNYIIKRAVTAGGQYDTVSTVSGSSNSYIDTSVVNGTTYYYVVSAVGAGGESGNSNVASATPKGAVNPNPGNGEPGDRALLRITMTNGTEKEYDLSMDEVNAFITWYDARAAGTAKKVFVIDKHNNNKGPFNKRKDYILFDNIYDFQVNEYHSGIPTNVNHSTEIPH